jgi:hypothetical protein
MPLLVEAERADELALQACFRVKAKKQRKDDPRVLRHRADPVAWVQERLGEFLWSKQRAILESIRDNRRTAVPSAHETGKSFTASRAVCWWLDVHPPGEAFVVTTAPTAPQVRAILWREINRAHRKGQLPGRTNQTEWFLNDEMVAFGRKPADYDPTAFQGIHARYVLVVIDEACGVPETIYQAANSLAANQHSRILAIGNPDDPSAHFAKVCAVGSGWNVVQVDGLDSPNFTGEEIPEDLRDLLISDVYLEELRQDTGDPSLPYAEQTSPVFLSKGRGHFPEDRADGVVPLSAVRKCQAEREWTAEQLLPVEIGFDVGAGGDAAVLRERRGVKTGRTERYHTSDSSELIGHAVQFINLTGATRIKVDVIGVGWAVAGRLEELRGEGVHRAEVVKVNVGEASTNPKRFPRLRDQLWWEVGRELIMSQAVDLADLDDVTIAQLIAPLWKPDSAGRIQVEKKADTKARIHRSPDDADAWLLAYAEIRERDYGEFGAF